MHIVSACDKATHVAIPHASTGARRKKTCVHGWTTERPLVKDKSPFSTLCGSIIVNQILVGLQL